MDSLLTWVKMQNLNFLEWILIFVCTMVGFFTVFILYKCKDSTLGKFMVCCVQYLCNKRTNGEPTGMRDFPLD